MLDLYSFYYKLQVILAFQGTYSLAMHLNIHYDKKHRKIYVSIKSQNDLQFEMEGVFSYILILLFHR